MSCCEGSSGGLERYPGTGCCGTSCAAGKTGCSASEPRIRSCFCQENVGCLDRSDCGGFRPRGTAATGACPGPCQCAEEEAWNRIVPPKPNCEWLTNFSELRRQWSDHGRQNNCKCCNCKPCRTAAPCRPCLPPAPICSNAENAPGNCQDCCNIRLSGGACGQSVNSPPPRRRDCSPMYSSGGCPPPSCNSTSSPCSSNAYHSPCTSPSECSIPNPCATPCRPPSSCQPCSPSPRPILKKRSCCQCITGYCMCQPMPRNCNCPPPVQVDARAERECSCDCPSSPECACPPSERRFPRTKVKCPNARMCCPTPRPQPGPKCCCAKCQPCLPPPCDPCTSRKCCTVAPQVKPCCGDSPCPEMSPCRPDTSKMSAPECRPTPPCAECKKMSPTSRPPQLGSVTSGSRPGSRQMRLLNQFRPAGPCCNTPSGAYRPTALSLGDELQKRHCRICTERIRLRHSVESCDQQSFRMSENQRSSNSYQNSMYGTLLCPMPCASNFSFLELFDCSWRLGRMLDPSCFQDWIFRNENPQPRCQFVDVAVGGNEKIPSTVDAAVYSQSRYSLKADEPTIGYGKSCECTAHSAIHVSIDDRSSEVSSVCGSLASSANAERPQGSRTETRASKLICDDNRNVISNIDLRMT